MNRIIIIDNYDRFQCGVYGEIIKNNKQYIIGWDGDKLVEQEIGELEALTDKIKPLFAFPMPHKSIILNAFANALSQEKIKTEDENLIEGKLIATEKHLEDLQKITFKLLKL